MTDLVKHENNPFWEDVEIELGSKRVTVATGMHVSNDGESVSHSGVHVVHKVDKSEFLKIYTRNMKAIFDLKPSSLKVLRFLFAEVQKHPGADGIYLHWFDVEKFFENEVKEVVKQLEDANASKESIESAARRANISRASFHTALNDMMSLNIIAKSTRMNLYWINPGIIFNGNRMTFINEYRIKSDAS
jgi:AraC-like DNA-binding protein